MPKSRAEDNIIYRIQRPDGSFRGAGPAGDQGSKIWTSPSHVKNHLKLAGHYSDPVPELVRKAGAVDNEVVQYELVEKDRIPVEDFL